MDKQAVVQSTVAAAVAGLGLSAGDTTNNVYGAAVGDRGPGQGGPGFGPGGGHDPARR